MAPLRSVMLEMRPTFLDFLEYESAAVEASRLLYGEFDSLIELLQRLSGTGCILFSAGRATYTHRPKL
jgi:hypothetical protein